MLMATNSKKQRLLLALCGLNPQIITEGLYCLTVKQKINFDKIIIFTTDECKENIASNLKRELKRMSKKFKFKPPIFNEECIYSVDEEISADGKENKFAELVFKTIWELTSNDRNVLFCLLSGGRKTMSVDLATAMTLLGGEHDKMFHVLVSKEFESKRLYFPENEKDGQNIKLIEKPFIKLRNKFLQQVGKADISFSNLIENIQREIDQSFTLQPLVFVVKERKVKIGDKIIELPPFQFAVYYFFATKGRFIPGGKNFSRTNSERLWKIYKRVASSYGHLERVRKFGFQNGIFDFEVIQKAISVIRRKIRTLLNNSPIAEYYIISVEGSYGKKLYGLKLPSNYIYVKKGNKEYVASKI